MKTARLLPAAILAGAIATATTACRHTAAQAADTIPDTLRVGTLYGPTSFFIYRGDTLGFDYDLIKEFCEAKGVALKFTIANSTADLLNLLDSGKIDVAASEIPLTAGYKERIISCGPEEISHQVLVQPKTPDGELITDVTQLIGKEVYVEAGSKYEQRLSHLNEELGGGIEIHPLKMDSIITEDLLDMVSSGQIPLTVIDSDIAQINRNYFGALDISMSVSFPQRSSWGVAPANAWLADSIDTWLREAEPVEEQAEMLKRYFELSKGALYYPIDLTRGSMSRFDDLFRKYAANIDVDWRLLAAQAWAESNFKPTARSWAGARGLMQIMPRTGAAYGLRGVAMNDPEASIRTATKILADLNKTLEPKVPDPEERVKFVLASYNVGLGHVYDAMRLAEKHGLDPTKWNDSVEQMLLLKSDRRYYTDPVVRHGYARGREPVEYVKKILAVYSHARRQIPA